LTELSRNLASVT